MMDRMKIAKAAHARVTEIFKKHGLATYRKKGLQHSLAVELVNAVESNGITLFTKEKDK